MSPRRTIAFTAVFVLLATSAYAQGPTADQPAAQVLFNDARALMKKGKYTDACPKLEESLRLDYGIGTEFNLADCNEHIGKTATAWSQFLSVAAAAKSKSQTDREQIARKRAAALEPQLARLVVDVPTKADGLEVTRDEITLGSAVWGTAVPVDPGSHKIVARAPGKKPWETSIDTPAGKTTKVVVPADLQGPAVAAAPKPATKPVTVAITPPPAPPPAPPVEAPMTTTTTTTSYDFPPAIDESRGQAQRTLGWVTTGLGAAGLGVAAGFGFASLSAKNASDPHCNGNVCDARGVTLRDQAFHRGDVATYAGLAGGALALTGIVLLATAPSGRAERTEVGVGPTGLIVRGSF